MEKKRQSRLAIGAFVFLILSINAAAGYSKDQGQDAAKEHLKRYAEQERAQFQQQADRIFEGTITDVAVFKGNTCNAFEGDLSKYKTIDAALDDLDLRWLVTLKIDNIIKGEFKKDTYEILVHSPVDSFGFHIGDAQRNVKRSAYGEEKYRVYIKIFPACPSMIAAEILD
ncbi:MAG: hypothetical protein PHV55_09710 [Candidatus Omnitrophica bacterium]|nr:hypothetical protein [Candidatus Omnitrophota bacterium]